MKDEGKVDAENGATADEEPKDSAGRRLYLASLGAGVVLREEGSRLFEYLVERGGPLEEPVRQRARQVKEDATQGAQQVGRAVDRVVGKVFGRYAGPSRDEVDELGLQVEKLGARVDKLSA